jgi:hypothetical protein
LVLLSSLVSFSFSFSFSSFFLFFFVLYLVSSSHLFFAFLTFFDLFLFLLLIFDFLLYFFFNYKLNQIPINLKCFLTIFLILCSSRYSVPCPSGGLTVLCVMVKELPAADSKMYCSSSLCLVITCMHFFL